MIAATQATMFTGSFSQKMTNTPDSASISLDSLLIRVGDAQCRRSFQQLFSVMSNKLYLYGIRNQLSEAQAKDLVQDTLTTVWQKAAMFKPDRGSASAWIYTIARNIRFDALRKQQSSGIPIAADDLWDIFSEEESIPTEASAENEVFRQQVAQYIGQLPEGQREVVEAIYIDGLTHQEYADQTGLPLGTVKSRIRLALQKLSEWVE